MNKEYILDSAQIFTLFFIMLGPIKLLAPFAVATKSLPFKNTFNLAWQSTLIGAVVIIVCGLIGSKLLLSWNIPVEVLSLTAALIFAYVAFTMILRPHNKPPEHSDEATTSPPHSLWVALTMIITPYGLAAFIALITLSESRDRLDVILTQLGIVMFLNLICMMFIHQIMGKVGALLLQILGVALGILQAALAMTMIVEAIKMLK